ncbi:MAG: enoyl-CoA hydratase [Sphingopyxis sp.]|nr:enoyl-CoA hydratase [Sphingopyxis sp.]
MAEDVVLFEQRGGIAIAALNRPEARNAVNGAVSAALAEIAERVEADDSIRVAILTSSSPRAFCAGADLAEVARGNRNSISHPTYGFGGFVQFPRKKPWIAAVNGFAMGGGFELAMSCDMIVAGQGAQFGLPESLRGLFAAAGGAFRLARLIPRAIANEVLVTGLRLNAERALALGLVNRVVAEADVLDSAIALAEAVAQSAPLSIAASLDLARRALDHDEADLWDLTRQHAGAVMRSADAIEGATAFIQKRAPNWTGK